MVFFCFVDIYPRPSFIVHFQFLLFGIIIYFFCYFFINLCDVQLLTLFTDNYVCLVISFWGFIVDFPLLLCYTCLLFIDFVFPCCYKLFFNIVITLVCCFSIWLSFGFVLRILDLFKFLFWDLGDFIMGSGGFMFY